MNMKVNWAYYGKDEGIALRDEYPPKHQLICSDCKQNVKQTVLILEEDQTVTNIIGCIHRYYCKDCFKKRFVL